MARKGGYGRSEPVEWVKLSQISYADAITSATAMGQDVQTWFADAVAHHIYRCDLLQVQERYRMDEVSAAKANRPTPDKHDPRYAVARAKPQITSANVVTASTKGFRKAQGRPSGGG